MGQRGGFRGCTIWFTGECAFLSITFLIRLSKYQPITDLFCHGNIVNNFVEIVANTAIVHLVPRHTSKIEITILCPGAEILLGPK